jgi:hypothetical protein
MKRRCKYGIFTSPIVRQCFRRKGRRHVSPSILNEMRVYSSTSKTTRASRIISDLDTIKHSVAVVISHTCRGRDYDRPSVAASIEPLPHAPRSDISHTAY